MFAAKADKEAADELAYWTIVWKESNSIVGFVELVLADAEQGMLEAGYWVSKGSRRRGIASDALHTLTSYLDAETSTRRIDLRIDPDNCSSRHVAKNAGYGFRGQAHSPESGGPDRPSDLLSYPAPTAEDDAGS